jgi:phage terminase small subunit
MRRGYRGSDGNTATLAKRPEIRRRVEEIKGEAAAAAQVSVRRTVTELARIAFADISEAVEIVDSKVRVKDTAQWSANLKAAVAEISDGREGLRIKFHSKPQAIETLARHLSMYRDNVDLNVNVSLADLVNGSYKIEKGEIAPPVIEAKALPANSTDGEHLPHSDRASDSPRR